MQYFFLPVKSFMYSETINISKCEDRICNSTFLGITQEGNVWTHQCAARLCFNLFSIWFTSHSLVMSKLLYFTGAVVLTWSFYSILYCKLWLCIVCTARQGSKGKREAKRQFATRPEAACLWLCFMRFILSPHLTPPVLVLWSSAVHCCISLLETFTLLTSCEFTAHAVTLTKIVLWTTEGNLYCFIHKHQSENHLSGKPKD